MSRIGFKLQQSNGHSLEQIYQALVEREALLFNEEQFQILKKFDRLLVQCHQRAHRFFKSFHPFRDYLHGIFLWGGVGVGKTMMMDMFYNALSVPTKARYHFHDFMQYCHESLRYHVGTKDPLKAFVKQLRRRATVLCLDEFLVEDIADAMILGRLLVLFERYDVVLVVTGNTNPRELYAGGLQRAKFLPAIQWIETHLEVVACCSSQDYRFRAVQKAGLYHYPITSETNETLRRLFQRLTAKTSFEKKFIEIHHHALPIVAEAGLLIWCEFKGLCQTARSQMDYLLLSKRYKVFLLSEVPPQKSWSADSCKRFVYLIDILYETKRLLVIQAAEPLEAWASVATRYPPFKRAYSRLQAMQDVAWLGSNVHW